MQIAARALQSIAADGIAATVVLAFIRIDDLAFRVQKYRTYVQRLMNIADIVRQ
jgi:hypothetical protein